MGQRGLERKLWKRRRKKRRNIIEKLRKVKIKTIFTWGRGRQHKGAGGVEIGALLKGGIAHFQTGLGKMLL
jgi:hypothetical protein